MDLSRIIPVRDMDETVVYYVQEGGGSQFCRIWGGLVLPIGLFPGFAVLVAEERYQMACFQDRIQHAIVEIEESDTSRLLRKCVEYSTSLGIRDWRGNDLNKADNAMISNFNRAQRELGHQQFYMRSAPLLQDGNPKDCFQYGLRRIAERTAPVHKTLNLQDCPKIQSALSSAPADFATGMGVENSPPLASLCFAVGSLDFYACCEPIPAHLRHQMDHKSRYYWSDKDDYDPLGDYR